MNVLIFCAHADDEVIGMGGTVARFAARNAHIRLVMFSEGAEGYASPAERERIVDIRDRETRAVCKLLGIESYRNLHQLDWDMRVNNHLYNEVIKEIRELKPDVIFTHRSGDYNDHQAVAKTVVEGWFHAALECAAVNGPVHKMVPLYEFEVIENMPEPGLIVDITDTLERKLEAMRIYSSQAGVVGGSEQLIVGRAMLRGQAVGVRYGEAFRRSAYRPQKINNVDFLACTGE